MKRREEHQRIARIIYTIIKETSDIIILSLLSQIVFFINKPPIGRGDGGLRQINHTCV